MFHIPLPALRIKTYICVLPVTEGTKTQSSYNTKIDHRQDSTNYIICIVQFLAVVNYIIDC